MWANKEYLSNKEYPVRLLKPTESDPTWGLGKPRDSAEWRVVKHCGWQDIVGQRGLQRGDALIMAGVVNNRASVIRKRRPAPRINRVTHR